MQTLDISYTVVLRNATFGIEKVFDSIFGLAYSREINGVGSFNFSINGQDSRIPLFKLDNIIEIRRGLLVAGLQKYTECVGLVRKTNLSVSNQGEYNFEISGVGLNHFLERTIINYPAATIKSYKLDASETAMKEYAEENCGVSAITDVGFERDSYGVLPNFVVDPSTGAGIEWEGDRAYANLLEVLKDIANYSSIDFEVVWDRQAKLFRFKTYPNGYGSDRTVIGLNRETGLNASGNIPVIFSLDRGNIQEIEHVVDRLSETNVVTVLGEGDGATRNIKVRSKITQYDSLWNRCESSRSKSYKEIFLGIV